MSTAREAAERINAKWSTNQGDIREFSERDAAIIQEAIDAEVAALRKERDALARACETALAVMTGNEYGGAPGNIGGDPVAATSTETKGPTMSTDLKAAAARRRKHLAAKGDEESPYDLENDFSLMEADVEALADDHPLVKGEPAAGGERPRIVCLCGSGRFREAFEEAEFNRTLAGEIVLTHRLQHEGHRPHAGPWRKIDLCDYVLVLNVDGYIGSSTRSEIEYATKLGRKVVYWESADEEGTMPAPVLPSPPPAPPADAVDWPTEAGWWEDTTATWPGHQCVRAEWRRWGDGTNHICIERCGTDWWEDERPRTTLCPQGPFRKLSLTARAGEKG